MTTKEKVQKLILYVECQKRAQGYDPNSVLYNKARALKRVLLKSGLSPELLDLPWQELEIRIHEAIASQLRL